jgi:MFS transporter, DHA2 family, multidrug resistance protein
VQHVQAGSPVYLQQAGLLARHLLTSTAAAADAQTKTILIIYRSVQAQASVLSYIDILQSLSVICACMIPLVLLMKRPPKGTQAAVH